ncbi:MAG: ABC transporter substrate-binding protein [Treponema sp.]|jgi:peptide/nickel transport system substrate-binding protein|nr:ABC transporter substrate-binding protein [Treponema sp.]
MEKRTMKLALIAALVLIAVISGCTKPAPKTGDPAITVLVPDSSADPMNVVFADPVLMSTDMFIYETVYEPLVRYGPRGVIEPGLAESWEGGDEGRSYTFHLRRGVTFSDGTDFTADNVIAAASRWNFQHFSSPMTGIEKIDDYTVKISFQESRYPCLIELTYPRPFRFAAPSAFDAEGKFIKPVGTGPWMLESNTIGEEVVLVPNPHYYGEKPLLSKMIFRKVADGQSRLMALQSGDADVSLADLPSEAGDVIRPSPHLAMLNIPGTMGFYLILNEENPLLQDLNLRKALNYGVDKTSIVDHIMGGGATAAKGLFSETVPYVTGENSPGYPFESGRAASLLADAGYQDTDGDGILEKNGSPLSLRLTFQGEEYASWKSMCEFLQAEFRKIGIDIKLEQRESSAYYDAIWSNRDFDTIIYRTYSDSYNPHRFLRDMFWTAGPKAVSWTDPKLGADIDAVLGIQDEAARQSAYDRIFKYLNDNAYTVPLTYPNKQYGYNTRLKNMNVAFTDYGVIDWAKINVAE